MRVRACVHVCAGCQRRHWAIRTRWSQRRTGTSNNKKKNPYYFSKLDGICFSHFNIISKGFQGSPGFPGPPVYIKLPSRAIYSHLCARRKDFAALLSALLRVPRVWLAKLEEREPSASKAKRFGANHRICIQMSHLTR